MVLCVLGQSIDIDMGTRPGTRPLHPSLFISFAQLTREIERRLVFN